jgi:hypothetical protein
VLLLLQQIIDDFWVIEAAGAQDDAQPIADVPAKAPEERFATEEKRKDSLNQVFTTSCELASKSVSATKKLDKYLRGHYIKVWHYCHHPKSREDREETKSGSPAEQTTCARTQR